jgi:hypothetical protein
MKRHTVVLALAMFAGMAGRLQAQAVWGQTLSGTGVGMSLYSSDLVGLQAGTYASSGGAGLYGSAGYSTGNAAGVWGESGAENGAGVMGFGIAQTGLAMGVYGITSSPQGTGVQGYAQAASGPGFGVRGITNSPKGTGVYGSAPYPGNAGYFDGNTVVAAPGSLSFGSRTRQMLNLWGPRNYGIGVQNDVLYFRTDDAGKANGFAWYLGGKHSDAAYDPGGGTVLMTLDQGGLTVNGTFVSSSDAALKQDVAPLDAQQVLDAVGRLKVQEWSYKASPEVRHVGPMAQDFQAAFGLGADDRHIAMVDADGVALASIQALRQLVATQQTEIGELRARMAEQGSRIEELLAQRTH